MVSSKSGGVNKMRKNKEQMEHVMQIIELIVKHLRFENVMLFTIGTMLGAILVLLFSKL
jgi:hypothetical protein